MIINNTYNPEDFKTFFLRKDIINNLILVLVISSTLMLLGLWNFLLFHAVAEFFSSIIMFSIFIISTNTYKVNKNNFFMFLGIGSCFVGMIDLLHALAYPNIGIFSGVSINLATQLPIISGFIWALTLLISNFYIRNSNTKFPSVQIYISFSLFTILSVASIFYFKVFPATYIDGQGITIFKSVSEYIIILIFIIAGILFYKNRKALDNMLLLYVSFSLMLSPISRFLLTLLGNDITDLFNIIAHVIKVMCFFFIYKGIVQVGLQRPFYMLTNKLNETDASLKDEYIKRKQMEEIIISNEKCYELLIENNKDAIFVHSDGKFVFVNQVAAKLLKVSKPKDLLGTPVEDVIPSYYKDSIIDKINYPVDTLENTPPLEISIQDLDGETKYIEAEFVHFVYKGNPAILNIVRDISTLKKVETLQKDIDVTREFSKAQAEFFANISHELKTPLNVLLGAIQILALPTGNAQEKLDKYLWTMKQNCFRLLRLVNNLIDLSKVESGYLNLHMRNYNIVNVVEEIALSVADYAENIGVELVFDTDIEAKIMAFDADKIERIILNLLSNSIKFTNPEDEILVTIADMKEKVKISVKDTGVGIPKDKLDIIFDRFAQVDKTLSRNHEGSGIGLALVKSLVELHGGSIIASSTFGEGTEFIIELPVKIIENEEVKENLPYISNIERINIEFSDIYSN